MTLPRTLFGVRRHRHLVQVRQATPTPTVNQSQRLLSNGPSRPENDSKQWSKATKWSSKGGASGGASGGADPKKAFDPKKRKVAFEKDKSFESWNKAKGKLTDDEYNKRRRTNVCINFGEVGHKFSDCPKPKP